MPQATLARSSPSFSPAHPSVSPAHPCVSPAHPSAQESDQARLLAAAARDDPTAWAGLVVRYRSLLHHMARRYDLSPDQQADVVQTTWLRLLENIHRIRDPQALPGWLATTAAREAIAVSRRYVRESPTADSGPEVGVSVDVDELLTAEWRARALRRAVETLPRRERELIYVLLEPGPPSYAEISERLGMPVGAIGPVRMRALQRLRRALPPEVAQV